MARLSSRKLGMNRTPIALILVVLSVISYVLLFFGCDSNEYRLSTSVVPSGGGTVSPSGGSFKGTVTLVASPSKYYTFKGWAGAASGNDNPLTVKMNSDKQIVAEFEKKTFNLSVETVPSGGGTVQPKTGTFEAGTQVKVTSTPAVGYRFDRWGGSITGTANQANILIDSEKAVIANFIKQYTLKLSSDPSEGGSITPGSGLYDAGTQVKLNPIPSFPYYPKNWIGADNNDIFPTTVTMNNDTSVAVIFARATESTLQTASGGIMAGTDKASPISSVPIQLNQYDWLQGEIVFKSQATNPPTIAYIQSPSGNKVKDLGRFTQKTFSFMAETSGTYTIVFENKSWYWANYNFDYTIWSK